MGRLPKVKTGMAVMHNDTANIFYVYYAGVTKICMAGFCMPIIVSTLKFNKNYTVLGAI